MLTYKQLRIYKFIVRRIADGERAPTYDEIAAHFGMCSAGAVHNCVKAISQRGYLHQTRSGIKLPLRVGAERGAFVADYSNRYQCGWPSMVKAAAP